MNNKNKKNNLRSFSKHVFKSRKSINNFMVHFLIFLSRPLVQRITIYGILTIKTKLLSRIVKKL